MLLNISSYITSAGLQAVTSSGPVGPYFAIKYFVPFYDYRLDTTISRGENANTTALSISSLNYVSATSQNLFGEKIFSNTSYTLSNNNFLYWNSTMGGLSPDGNYTNVPSPQSVTTPVNLDSNGLPLSVVVSGSNFTSPSGPGFFNISGTHLYTAGQVSTYNPISGTNWPLSAFYRVDSYSPNANGLTCATGTFKCRIPPSNSSFKFNGLALYAVKVNSNGIDDYGNGVAFAFNPVLFSVVLLNQAQFKQSQTGGINDFEISVDLGFDWNTVSPGVSGNPIYINNNYWVKLPTSTTTSANGLNYTGDVVISSSAVGGSWFPAAKLTVTEPSKQQLRLANDLIKYTDFRTIRFPINVGGVFPNSTDMAVLSIDTSCPQDSLLQLGYQTSALGIKSVAIGCYASATGYSTTNGNTTSAEVDIGGEGGYTVSIGVKSLSQGFGSVALGYNTSSIGYLNFAGGDSSLASLNLLYGGGADPGLNVTPINGLNFAYGKSVTAISRANPTNFDYIQLAGNMLEDADGSNVAFGFQTYAGGGVSFAHGILTSALGFGSFSLGQQTLANGAFSIAGGINSVAMSDVGFALGSNVSAFGPYNFVYGVNAQASSLGRKSTPLAIAIGQNVSATTSYSIALGTNSLASQYNSIAIGQNFNPLSNPYLAMTVSNGVNSVAIGQGTSAILGTGCFALGYKVLSDGNNSFGLGNTTYAHGDNSLATGFNTTSFGKNSLALNENTSAIGIDSIAGGFSSIAGGDYSVALGYINNAAGKYSVALGNASIAQYDNSIAIGNNVSTTQTNQIVIGSCSNNVLIQGANIQIGGNCPGNVTIPGISQFNDSIRFAVNFVSSLSKVPQMQARTLTITVSRAGYTRAIPLTETGYNTNVFNIGTPVGSTGTDILIATANPFTTYYKLSNGGVGSQIVCNPGASFFSGVGYNISVSLNKITNDIIIFVNNATNLGLPISYSFSPDNTNTLYQANFNNDNANGNNDVHTFNWIKNLNAIDGYISYDKTNTSIDLRTVSSPGNGDGVCSFNLYNSTIGGGGGLGGEGSRITLLGDDNYDDFISTFSPGKFGTTSYNMSTYDNLKHGSGQQTAVTTGMFVNSNGHTIISGIKLN